MDTDYSSMKARDGGIRKKPYKKINIYIYIYGKIEILRVQLIKTDS